MAVYIEIKKLSETASGVVYSYAVSHDRTGRVLVDVGRGVVRLLEAAPGDESGRGSCKVIHKLKQHLKEGRMPDSTCWAS